MGKELRKIFVAILSAGKALRGAAIHVRRVAKPGAHTDAVKPHVTTGRVF